LAIWVPVQVSRVGDMFCKGTHVSKFHARALWLAIMATVSVVVGLVGAATFMWLHRSPEQVVTVGAGGFGATMVIFFGAARFLQGGGRDDE
jgi:hypothetical protein